MAVTGSHIEAPMAVAGDAYIPTPEAAGLRLHGYTPGLESS